ncbi:hypothetical protein FHU41_002287 [Psychromicrobium silvestre]|uniref:DUF2891 domain-containing protein n=1 Tax=Psychromicrobium silvestre TaxID=1645614 RepID=A0A7Y9S965_9MICC|nr:DUF2891 family protein [Psychromicrobium silvestre]NYE96037.1 hypothetical protein [Psychromicrobium silvestre]
MNTAEKLAPIYAAIVLENLSRSHPYHLVHLVRAEQDVRSPAELYPAFYTSYDWHSCVHMHWLGVELLRSGLLEDSAPLRDRLNENLSGPKLAAEAEYLRANPIFERPYGWAWAARLAAASSGFAAEGDRDAAGWSGALEPLTEAVFDNARRWSQAINHPVRHGVHSNTAFGLALLLDAASALGRTEDRAELAAAAERLFGADRGWAGRWELSGQDFLSAGLSEADLMSRVLPPGEFKQWFAEFLPEPADVVLPAVVTDKTDPQMVHLDGLNLSRAGSLYRISSALGSAELREAADGLLAHGLDAVATEEFVSSHWLASFAWDALLSRSAV